MFTIVSDHPTDEQLAAWVDIVGLGMAEFNEIDQHVRACERCRLITRRVMEAQRAMKHDDDA
jgi:hypothetical protein